MKSKILIVLSVFTGLLLLTNLFGWNTYLNFKLGSKDLIFGTTIGMAHVAFADHSEMHDQSNIWMNNGFISLYSEKPGAELKIFGMDIINDQGYFALEFSLLLMLLGMVIAAVILKKKNEISPKKPSKKKEKKE